MLDSQTSRQHSTGGCLLGPGPAATGGPTLSAASDCLRPAGHTICCIKCHVTRAHKQVFSSFEDGTSIAVPLRFPGPSGEASKALLGKAPGLTSRLGGRKGPGVAWLGQVGTGAQWTAPSWPSTSPVGRYPGPPLRSPQRSAWSPHARPGGPVTRTARRSPQQRHHWSLSGTSCGTRGAGEQGPRCARCRCGPRGACRAHLLTRGLPGGRPSGARPP